MKSSNAASDRWDEIEMHYTQRFSEPTLGSYLRSMRAYCAWCDEKGMDLGRIKTLRAFMTDLFKRQQASTTIAATYSGLRAWFNEHGEENLDTPKNSGWIKGLRRRAAEQSPGKAKQSTVPLQAKELVAYATACKDDLDPVSIRDRAIILLAWHLAPTITELTKLKWEQIELEENEDCFFTFPKRKVEQSQRIPLVPAKKKAADGQLALLAWKSVAPFAAKNDYVFTTMSKNAPLSGQLLNGIVKKRLGYDYTFKSIRDGWFIEAVQRKWTLLRLHVFTGISSRTLADKYPEIEGTQKAQPLI